MKKIGFKNFRRFTKFSNVDYSNITFLVGKNNSGKSTLVKAVLLVKNFLKSRKLDYFSFGSDIINDANIVTFGRAFSKNAEEDDHLFFYFEEEGFQFCINLYRVEENSTVAKVGGFNIVDNNRKIDYGIGCGLISNEITIGRLDYIDRILTPSEEISNTTDLIRIIETGINDSKLKKSDPEYLSMVNNLQETKQRLKLLKSQYGDAEDPPIFYNLSTEFGDSNDLIFELEEAAQEFTKGYQLRSAKVHSGETVSDMDHYRAYYEDRNKIQASIDHLRKLISEDTTYYIGAGNNKQSAFFSIRDKDNALAQAIHDFNLLGVQIGDPADIFLNKWMRIFDLGTDYEIKEIEAGEGYIVLIARDGNQIHLADKGMGSVQLMLLLFRIAAIVRTNKSKKKNIQVIIEEPESNLHPALQSMLCVMFLEVHETFHIDFIIETHSEYIIRKSQLLVKNNEYEIEPNDNPFSVIYFDKESNNTWNMEYRPDGKFSNDFGKGFYDESSSLVLDLL